jgi:hypothetical protein
MTPLPTEPFAAFVGLEWADTKHDICLQAADSATREFRVLAHTPDTIDEWVNTLRQRFKGRLIAIRLELNKGHECGGHKTNVAWPAPPEKETIHEDKESRGLVATADSPHRQECMTLATVDGRGRGSR